MDIDVTSVLCVEAVPENDRRDGIQAHSSTALLVSIRSALQALEEEELFDGFEKSSALVKRLESDRF